MSLAFGINPRCFVVGPASFPNLAANQNNSSAPSFGNAAVRHFIAMRPCAVLAMSAAFANGSTTGTVTMTVFKNDADPGTEYDLAIVNSAADVYATKRFGTPLALVVGDRISVRYSSTADWNGTAGDINVWLELG